jgi:hypothetical protein
MKGLSRMEISVIICTHNPRREALARTLNSLRAQSMEPSRWELLLIDNCSKEPVEGRFDVSWHPNGKILLEQNLGLTPARMRGIRESCADILCFVDDDNVLDPDYLENALKIGDTCPHLGCWGGEILPEYEIPPEPWFKGCEDMLVVRPLDRDRWGNAYSYDDSTPCGAGMCARRSVVSQFLTNCNNSELRRSLGRAGTSLGSGEDVDLAHTAVDMGMGTGRFKALRLIHLIPAGRLDPAYLARLAEGMAESNVYLDFLRCKKPANISLKLPIGSRIQFWRDWLKAPTERKRIMIAQLRGRRCAYIRLKSLQKKQLYL